MKLGPRWLAAALLVAAGLVARATPAGAQDLTAIRGIVHDLAGTPLPGVEVVLVGMDRSVYTNARGQFVLDGLRFRVYNLLIRHPGYAAARARVPAETAEPTEIDVYLTQIPHVLDNIVVTGTRPGLHGLVGDSVRRPIPGARVVLLGGAGSTTTDSVGYFSFPDIKRGPHVVLAEMPGMVSRPLHVEVPASRNLEVVLFMAPEPPGYRRDFAEEAALEDLGKRLAWNPARTRMTRQELERSEGRALCDIARIRASIRSEEPDVILNGVHVLRQWPLCGWNADEIELVEWGVDPCTDVTGTTAALLGVYCTGARAQSLLRGRAGVRNGFVMIWTRP